MRNLSRAAVGALSLSLAACAGAAEPAEEPGNQLAEPAPAAEPAEPAGEPAEDAKAAGPAGEAAEAGGDQANADGEAEAEGHHHDFPPKANAFHDVLAPIWHSEPGEARAGAACDAAADMRTRAGAVADAPAPEAADSAEGWNGDADALVTATEALADTCNEDGDVEAALKKVHDAFHAVVAHVGHGG